MLSNGKTFFNIITRTKMWSVLSIIVLIVVFVLIMIMLTGTVIAENSSIVLPKKLTESSNEVNSVSQFNPQILSSGK